MHARVTLFGAALLASGCSQKFARLLAVGHTVLLIVTGLLTLAGLFALRSALRDVKRPDRAGRAALSSLTAIITLALPGYLFVVYGADREGAEIAFAVVALGFSLGLLVLCVLALVRWSRNR